jgi:hypothetical protein
MANCYFYRPIAAAACLSLISAPLSFSQVTHSASVQKPLPVSFEVNGGQAQPGIDFVARVDGYSAHLRAGRVVLHMNRSGMSNLAPEAAGKNLEAAINLVDGNKQAEVQPEDKLPGYSNFLFGTDPHKWITHVTQYAKVRYANVYPGIDVVYHGNQDRLENDFIVLPGADARQITLGFSGVEKPSIDKSGELLLRVGDGVFRLRKPQAYQLIGGKEVEVEAAYLLGDGHVHFQLGRYDAGSTLIIDPVLVYSTFLGGAFGPNGGFQIATAVAVDAGGNLYVSGNTDSTSFPVTPGVLGSTPASTFVSKLNPAGTSLIYSTYVSGMKFLGQYANSGMAVDAAGNVYIAGFGDVGLPIPAGSTPFQSAPNSLAIVKLNSTGTAVLAGTYLGGSGSNPDLFGGLAVDSAGSVYITGTTSSANFPTQNPLQASLGASGQNAFVTKLNPAMNGLVYSTYLGQDSSITVARIALDGGGNAYVAGGATPGFPTTIGAFETTAPLGGPFLAKLNPAGSSLLYATYLTGSDVADLGAGGATAVTVDGSGNVFLIGQNTSFDFPVVNPIQPCTANGTAFLSEFNPEGALAFSTCLGNNSTVATSIALDTFDKVYISGASDTGLPLKNPIDSNPLGYRPFITEIDTAAHALLFSSFVAGKSIACCDGSGDHINAIAVDSNGNIYAVGDSGTYSTGGQTEPQLRGDLFPIFNAWQPYFPNTDVCNNKYGCAVYAAAIIMKISPGAGAAAAVAPSQMEFKITQLGTTTTPGTVTVYNLGTDPLTVSNATVTGDFAQTNNCGAVAPSGGSCKIQVTFTPTALGARAGALTITDSSPGSPHTVALTGQGGQGFVIPSPDNLSFPDVLVGDESSMQPAAIKNAGPVDVPVASIVVTGPFEVDGTGGCTAVPANSECDFSVLFKPTAAGAVTGAITITDTAAGSPQTISLTGTGATGFVIGPASETSVTVSAGAPATFMLYATADSSFSGSVNFNCMGAPLASTCTVSPNPLGLTAGSSPRVSVVVATTVRSNAQSAVDSQNQVASRRHARSSAALASLLLLGIVLAPTMPFGRNTKKRLNLLVVFMLLSISIGALGCGGGGSNHVTGTPSGTYTIVVTGASGSTTRSTTLTLTVQ